MRILSFLRVRPLVLAACFLAAPSLGLAATTTLSLQPNSIDMGAQYNGADIEISGQVPADSQVIVRFVGTPDELHLREKGKVFGLLWMNVGKVKLSNVPSVCLTRSSQPLAQLGQGALPYTLENVIQGVGVEEEGQSQHMDVRHQLLLLKEKEGLYNQEVQAISFGPVKNGVQHFTAHVKVPSTLKPGSYTVETVALNHGKVVGSEQASIEAALTGFPKWLSDLAYQKSVLYGVIATVIALVSGLVIGLVFQSKEAH